MHTRIVALTAAICILVFLPCPGSSEQETGDARRLETLRRAAELGDPRAQWELGLTYRAGVRLQKDPVQAFEWIRKSAEQGFSSAQFELGDMYISGTGTEQNVAEGVGWILKAAAQGEPAAQYAMGVRYYRAEGVKQDMVQAYKWLALASAARARYASPASAALDELKGQLTPAQLSEAERQVKEWKPVRAQLPLSIRTVPVALERPLPPYTREARQARIEGMVLLQCVVRKDGRAEVVKVIKSLGYGLDESAISTIQKYWRFQPGTMKGEPVDVEASIEVSFRLGLMPRN